MFLFPIASYGSCWKSQVKVIINLLFLAAGTDCVTGPDDIALYYIVVLPKISFVLKILDLHHC
jgi:hypothetical protein